MMICLNSCSIFKGGNDLVKLEGTTWTLTAIEGKPVDGDSRAFLKFNDKETRVSGKAFCNSVSGEYERIAEDQLTFGALVSTKMYCEGVMDLENQMVTNLQNVRRFEIKSGMLYLYSTDLLLLTFKK